MESFKSKLGFIRERELTDGSYVYAVVIEVQHEGEIVLDCESQAAAMALLDVLDDTTIGADIQLFG
jgi:hypothetical protein